MAVQPRRRTRALNVTSEPAVPAYETSAREFIRQNKLKNEATKLEKAAKAATNKAMAVANIGRFEIEEGGVTYDAVIAGGEKDSINIDTLYKMVTDGEITMPQFLKCVGSTQAAVKKELGSNALARVLDTAPTEAELSIKPRKK